MAYGNGMTTITIRVTDEEKARLDELAQALVDAETDSRWWRPKLGRGDIVRLGILLLEERVTGSAENTPAMRAQRSHGGGYGVRKLDPPGVRVEKLRDHVRNATPAPTIPGQTSIDEGEPALGIDVGAVTRGRAR